MYLHIRVSGTPFSIVIRISNHYVSVMAENVDIRVYYTKHMLGDKKC